MFIAATFVFFLIKKRKASNKNDVFLLLFAVLLFLFATFEPFLRHSFTTYFFAQDKAKNDTLHADYVTRN